MVRWTLQHSSDLLQGPSRRHHPAARLCRLRAVSSLPLAATDITAFHVIGALLAIWAVALAALGTMRPDFPGKGAGQKVVMGISAVLVIGAISSAIITAKDEPKGAEQAGKANKPGGEGSPQPKSGVAAPGTGANSGQTPGGNAQPKPGGATSKTLLLSADPTGQLRFDKSTLQASAGAVKIVLNNPAPVPHNISLEGPGGLQKQGPTVSKGGSSQVTATLKAGTYTYFCSVPGHRQAGMQGTLTVK
jgi:plastocyanin